MILYIFALSIDLFYLSFMSLYLCALSINLFERFIKCLPQSMSLKLVVEGLELMTKGFKLSKKLNIGNFRADLSEGCSYLLENLIL
jgi:hypothetical protein